MRQVGAHAILWRCGAATFIDDAVPRCHILVRVLRTGMIPVKDHYNFPMLEQSILRML
jgi:hypothetical protein